MELSKTNGELSAFVESGIYRFEHSNVVFMDPVRVLNRSYTRFRVSPLSYYSRFFESRQSNDQSPSPSVPKKRKRKHKTRRALNEREQLADQRHQQVRPMLLKAHEVLMGATDLLAVMSNLRSGFCSSAECHDSSFAQNDLSFVVLGQVYQAPLYEIILSFTPSRDGGFNQHIERRVVPVFNNLVCNETRDDVEAEFLNKRYVIPRESGFYMSDLGQIYNLIPADSDCGFNLIVVDPPWENASAHQKLLYPTLPNLYFLSIPIKQLIHTNGALVALWVTNREKLRTFVEKELFPMWGVSYAATFFWLKVKANGSLVGDLDLFHHRPYECLLLGYCHKEGNDSEQMSTSRIIQDNQIIISIPGNYSRKPPVGELLLDYVPGQKPARCIELFARELTAGWTSWGNEPLHFQDSHYFLRDEVVNTVR